MGIIQWVSLQLFNVLKRQKLSVCVVIHSPQHCLGKHKGETVDDLHYNHIGNSFVEPVRTGRAIIAIHVCIVLRFHDLLLSFIVQFPFCLHGVDVIFTLTFVPLEYSCQSGVTNTATIWSSGENLLSVAL